MKFNAPTLAAISALTVTLFALPALAQNTPNIDKREANQQQRIDQGVKSGELTQKETAKLDKGQAKVDKMEDKAKADGTMTPKETKHINTAQNKQSHRIHRAKHNRRHDRNHDGMTDTPKTK